MQVDVNSLHLHLEDTRLEASPEHRSPDWGFSQFVEANVGILSRITRKQLLLCHF